MRPLSASGITRAILCPASTVLPAVDESSDAAHRGTAVHDFLCNAVPYGRDIALSKVPAEHREQCELVNLDAIRDLIGDAEVRCEVAFEYHPTTETACILGDNIGRNYPNRPGCIYGTADLLLIWRDATGKAVDATVYDYKTGQMVEPAGTNWQIKTLATMASRAFNLDDVDGGLLYVWGESVIPDVATFGSFDLDAAAGELIQLVQRVEHAQARVDTGHVPDVQPSDQACKWCPAKRACPARNALVKAAMAGSLEVPTVDVKALSAEQLADAYKAVVRRYKPIIEAFEDEIKAEVLTRGESLDLGDGCALGIVPGRETIDASVAFKVLEEKLGTKLASEATKLSVTKESLKKVAKKDADKLLDAIRKAGGVKVGEPSVREMKAR